MVVYRSCFACALFFVLFGALRVEWQRTVDAPEWKSVHR